MTHSKPVFHPCPTKVVPDYSAVIVHAKLHGHMLLDMSVNWNALHVACLRAGIGVYKVKDYETGVQLGWRVCEKPRDKCKLYR